MKRHSFHPTLNEAFEIFGDKSEYVVAAPQYRAAANTAMGWKNANLRSELLRLLRRAGVSGCPRLFHSMRASRQTELQREFPLHDVCSRLAKSQRRDWESKVGMFKDDFSLFARPLFASASSYFCSGSEGRKMGGIKMKSKSSRQPF
jgi:hypothetical protein